MSTPHTPEPWASVKNGKWHKVETMPQHFRDLTKSICGVSFEPHNASEGKPDYIGPWAFCDKCSHATVKGEIK